MLQLIANLTHNAYIHMNASASHGISLGRSAELVEFNVLFRHGATNDTDINVDVHRPRSPHYKTRYTRGVQTALCRRIRGDMYSLPLRLKNQPHNCHLTINIAIAGSRARGPRTA